MSLRSTKLISSHSPHNNWQDVLGKIATSKPQLTHNSCLFPQHHALRQHLLLGICPERELHHSAGGAAARGWLWLGAGVTGSLGQRPLGFTASAQGLLGHGYFGYCVHPTVANWTGFVSKSRGHRKKLPPSQAKVTTKRVGPQSVITVMQRGELEPISL